MKTDLHEQMLSTTQGRANEEGNLLTIFDIKIFGKIQIIKPRNEPGLMIQSVSIASALKIKKTITLKESSY